MTKSRRPNNRKTYILSFTLAHREGVQTMEVKASSAEAAREAYDGFAMKVTDVQLKAQA